MCIRDRCWKTSPPSCAENPCKSGWNTGRSSSWQWINVRSGAARLPSNVSRSAPIVGALARQEEDHLADIIVVTSGKGGVGKTTTSASLATGLARSGKKVAVIDFDVGLRNLDLIMGCERRVVYDFVNVIHGEATLKQALIKDKRFENLYVLAASQTRDKDCLLYTSRCV